MTMHFPHLLRIPLGPGCCLIQRCLTHNRHFEPGVTAKQLR